MNAHLITKLTMTNKKTNKNKNKKANLVKKLRITPPNTKTENHFLKKKQNKTKKHQKKKRKKKETEGIPRPVERAFIKRIILGFWPVSFLCTTMGVLVNIFLHLQC